MGDKLEMENWVRGATLLISSRVISSVGSMLSKVAIIFAIKEYGTPFLMSLYLTAQTAPALIAPFFGSMLVTKYPPKKIITTCDFICAVLMLIFFASILALGWAKALPLVIIITFLLCVASSFYSPLSSSLVKSIVPTQKVTTYASISQPSVNAAYSLGEFLGSWFLKFMSSSTLILVDALTFLASFLLIGSIKTEREIEIKPVSLKSHSLEILKLVFTNSIIARLNLVRILYLIVDTATYMLLPYTIANVTDIGFLLGFNTIGFVLAGVINIKLSPSPQSSILISKFGMIITLLGFGLAFQINNNFAWIAFILIKGILNGITAIGIFKLAVERLSDYEISAYVAGTMLLNGILSICISWILGLFMTADILLVRSMFFYFLSFLFILALYFIVKLDDTLK